jgi:hypothetical protein
VTAEYIQILHIDVLHMLHRYLATTMRVFEAANFLSIPLGFVTEPRLQRGELGDCKVLLLASVQQ